MTKKQRRPDLPEGDDGRTIANMNVEGMPWYRPQASVKDRPDGQEPAANVRKPFPLTREETRFYTFGALKAALLVTGFICLGIVLFILFCQFIWFR